MAKSKSRQPRFGGSGGMAMFDVSTMYNAIYQMFEDNDIVQLPPYVPDSRNRDAALREWAMKEPHWSGVLKACAMLDANRGWSFVGGRNQANRYSQIMHNADGGDGSRQFMYRQSMAFRTADIGAITEIGSEGVGGPLRALYSVDPARCRLTGDIDYPLEYYPAVGRNRASQRWPAGSFFRIVSNPSCDERYRGLGLCATSLAYELTVLLWGVLRHDQEQLAARMPRGLLILSGISERQWNEALSARKARLDEGGHLRSDGVMVLASAGEMSASATLTALSQLPAGFDREVFINQLLYGYALVVGRDPSEFWPVQTGSIGRGNEPEVQHRKAVVKGGAEFLLAWQEQFQRFLPPSLLFEFDERDEEGERVNAERALAWAKVAAQVRYPTGSAADGEAITQEQYLSYLVDHNVIPPEWTEAEEEVKIEDTEGAVQERQAICLARDAWRKRLLERADVRRAVECFPNEPIVRLSWNMRGLREHVLWNSGWEAARPQVWRGFKLRQEEDIVLYDDGDVVITEADVTRAIEDGCRRIPGNPDDPQHDPGLCALLNARPLLAGEVKDD
jgi:hypothetical protein